MVLYLCIIPNRGTRIGHQTYEHFALVAYCKKYNFNFVYHKFTCNSAEFEDILHFGDIYNNHYENLKTSMKIISLNELSVNISHLHNKLLEIHNYDENIMVFDSICGNEIFFSICNLNKNDLINTKKSYRNIFMKHFTNYVNNDYICIHIRCGDIAKDTSRYLDVNYFIEKYNKLINKLKINLPVYIVAESNFNGDIELQKRIINCNIIKSDVKTSFYYIVNCKYLIASRSGFSNLAYILGNMQVVKPPNDWNEYYDNIVDLDDYK